MICVICGNAIEIVGTWTEGHNAEPVATGRCCGVCNSCVVIPARLGAPISKPDDIDDLLNAMLRETDCDRSGDLSDKLVKASMTYSRGEIVVALAITLAALVDQCPSPPLMLDLAVRLAERFLEVGE